MNALTPITLALLLTACGATAPVIQTKTEYRFPPTALMEPTPMPEYTGTQWKDVADHAVLLDSLLGQCNGDKSLLRQWAAEHRSGGQASSPSQTGQSETK